MRGAFLTALILGLFLGAESRRLAATARSTAVASGNASASSNCKAANGNTAICDSVAVSDGGNKAVAVSKANAQTGDVVVESVANALGGGNRETIAVAIGEAVNVEGDKEKAADGLADVFVKAVNEGAGVATAVGIADGVAKGGDVQKAVVAAIAKIVKEDGCDVVRPTLADAFAKASEENTVQGFADAFDVDVKVSECIYPKCSDDRWHCCKSPDDPDKCSAYATFKTTPRLILTCESCGEKQCLCP